ncbi:MAG: UDP-N-acetylmuramoyl-tripeptide--D-alanyl-D-alanine ligase [Rectinemataceae bacterium]|nr:UDP-N-acetylmuramoyl-tripeptide--D-alanyl-D-alanine ligase [Rectinemataceae bacterium]
MTAKDTMESGTAGESFMLFTAGEAAALLGCGFRGNVDARITSVAADSRAVVPGTLFVALPGERTDGHDYIAPALRSGASCILACSIRTEAVHAAFAGSEKDCALMLVENTLTALQTLARIHRERHPSLLRIGITGSSGKTTTKECIAAILDRGRKVVMNPGNFNSDIGLSLSMFLINREHEIGVFEMGMNRAGEMKELAKVYEPDIALIINVGTAHIGILGSRDAIAKEKKDIFSCFSGAGRGLVWEADDYNEYLKRDVAGFVGDFGEKSTPGYEGARAAGLEGFEIRWKGRTIRFPLPGWHNLLDALAAISVALEAGASEDDIVAGLESVKPLFGRSEILHGRVTLIRDCYNANPESVEAVLDFCDSVETVSRRIYVLGSMLELGTISESAHAELGTRAGRSKAAALFFFGEETAVCARKATEAGFAGTLWQGSDVESLKSALRSFVGSGDIVLVKGSRGMALERVVECLPGFAGAKDASHAS